MVAENFTVEPKESVLEFLCSKLEPTLAAEEYLVDVQKQDSAKLTD